MTKDLHDNENKQAEETFDLSGSFRFKVDAKGRVALPSRFRKVLSKDLVVSKAPTGDCIFVFEPDGFNSYIKQLFDDHFGGYNSSKLEHINLLRKLKAGADQVDVDSAGRITLKQDIREDVGIAKDVVLLGSTGRLEIWDADAFDAQMEETDLNVFFE